MNSRAAIKLLLGFVLGLPILMVVLHWVGGLLAAMSDTSAAAILSHVSTVISILWIVAVVGLVIAMAIEVLDDGEGTLGE